MSFRWTTWATVTGGVRGAAFWELWLFLRLKGNFFSMLFVPVGREQGMKAMHRETRSHVQLGHRGCGPGCHHRSRAGHMKRALG